MRVSEQLSLLIQLVIPALTIVTAFSNCPWVIVQGTEKSRASQRHHEGQTGQTATEHALILSGRLMHKSP